MPLGGAVWSGVHAKIDWAYYNAARIKGYSISKTRGEWSARGTFEHVDRFNITRKPLHFVALHAKGSFRFPIRELHIENGSFIARLGAPMPGDAPR